MSFNSDSVFIRVYNIILESYIVFVIFAIFFFVLLKYIITPYEIEIVKKFAITALKNYGVDEMFKISNYFTDVITNAQRTLNNSAMLEQTKVNEFNAEYEMKQIYILVGMTIGLLIVMIIPIIIRIVKIRDIDWIRLLSVFAFNLIIILVCEALLFIYVIGNYNTIRFYPLLELGQTI